MTHENDYQGEHGSHVAGIASANAYIPAGRRTYSKALDAVKVQGVAPDAQLMVMKVFGKGGGAFDSDYMVAIEDAILLGADAVNLSLGSSNPRPQQPRRRCIPADPEHPDPERYRDRHGGRQCRGLE